MGIQEEMGGCGTRFDRMSCSLRRKAERGTVKQAGTRTEYEQSCIMSVVAV